MFTRTLLSEEKSGKLESSQDEVENHLRETHSDPARDQPLGECSNILPEEKPTNPLEMKEPSWKEVSDVLKMLSSWS